jgi:hypothetical protein
MTVFRFVDWASGEWASCERTLTFDNKAVQLVAQGPKLQFALVGWTVSATTVNGKIEMF